LNNQLPLSREEELRRIEKEATKKVYEMNSGKRKIRGIESFF
jgi:hypothetical protein